MRLAILLTISVAAFAQSITLSPGRLMLRPGESTDVKLSITGQATPTITGIQWTEAATGLTTALPVVAGTALSKTVACGTTAAKICLLYSLGTQTIANGQIATVTVTVPANASPGVLSYAIAGTLGGTATGSAVAITAPFPITFTVVSRFDLNSDGKVDVLDLTLLIQQIIGNQAANNCDVTGDSVCNIQDGTLLAANVAP